MNFKGIIFDLDETVLNTRFLKPFRDSREWNVCYKRANECEMYPGIFELFDLLKKNNIPIGFVTNSQNTYAKKVISASGLYHNVLVAYFDTKKHKPNPEPMLLCAEKLGVDPKNIIAIGDDVKDIEAANKANMFSVGVTWGISTYEQLSKVQPDIICNNDEELLALFK